jgi:hypothetical protein
VALHVVVHATTVGVAALLTALVVAAGITIRNDTLAVFACVVTGAEVGACGAMPLLDAPPPHALMSVATATIAKARAILTS